MFTGGGKHVGEEARCRKGCSRDLPERYPGADAGIPRSLPALETSDVTAHIYGHIGFSGVGKIKPSMAEEGVLQPETVSQRPQLVRSNAVKLLTLDDIMDEFHSEYTLDPEETKMKFSAADGLLIAPDRVPRSSQSLQSSVGAITVHEVEDLPHTRGTTTNNSEGLPSLNPKLPGNGFITATPLTDAAALADERREWEPRTYHLDKKGFDLPTRERSNEMHSSESEIHQVKGSASSRDSVSQSSKIVSDPAASPGPDLIIDVEDQKPPSPCNGNSATDDSEEHHRSLAGNLERLNLNDCSIPLPSRRPHTLESSLSLVPRNILEGKELPKAADQSLCLGIGSWTQGDDHIPESSRNSTGPSIVIAIRSLSPDIYSRFDKQWLASITQCTGGSSQSNQYHPYCGRNSSQYSASFNKGGFTTSSNHQGLNSGDDELPDEDSDDGTPQQPELPSVSSDVRTLCQIYACPFYQYDPAHFSSSGINRHLYRTCENPTFESYSRVTEHLYRSHLSPVYCSRCGVVFKGIKAQGIKAQTQLDEHIRGIPGNGCENRPLKPFMGISPETKQKLQAKRKRGLTDEEKWIEMYQIILPGEPVPSPFHGCFSMNPSETTPYQSTSGTGDLSEEAIRELVRPTLNALAQNNLGIRTAEDIIISLMKDHRRPSESSAIDSNTNPRISNLGFDNDFRAGITPKLTATTWAPQNATQAFSSPEITSYAPNHSAMDPNLPLSWREPPQIIHEQSLPGQIYTRNLRNGNQDRMSLVFTDPPSSDSGYHSNSIQSPGLLDPRSQTQESSSRAFFGPNLGDAGESSDSAGPKPVGESQKMYLSTVPDTAEFPWDAFLYSDAFK